MAKDSSSQKFIGRNNAPRVQIEYDVEIYGSNKKVELPFVTGVMADLSGHRDKPLAAIEERKFLTFDQDNFDARMRAIKPRLKFYVDNTLSDDEELLDIELEFESMDDFSPGAVARHIPQMEKLLEARTHLAELITYMDGKASAEEVVKRLLEQPDFLQRLAVDAQSTVTSLSKDLDNEATEGDE
ncbi:type VI secretion system contractile sheath small subunit [Serratia sp. D1N4]|jgi:type VI secretion system protein ImpB